MQLVGDKTILSIVRLKIYIQWKSNLTVLKGLGNFGC